jgi:hypothetical protein
MLTTLILLGLLIGGINLAYKKATNNPGLTAGAGKLLWRLMRK